MYTTPIFSIFFVSTVLAHGGVWNYTIDGIDYPGYQWWGIQTRNQGTCDHVGTPPLSQRTIQRKWPCRNPIESLLDPHFACNVDGSAVSNLHARVPAGGVITAHWERGFSIGEVDFNGNPMPVVNETWGHEWGPIMAYMAACNGPCEKVDANAGQKMWFKVDEGGLINGTAGGGYWRQMDLHRGEPWSFNVPERLKPGYYLVRHEVVALHTRPHQWYMECGQIEVTGDGDAYPGEEYLVSFPGAYDPNDPELNYNFWTTDYNNPSYKIPGPSIWTG